MTILSSYERERWFSKSVREDELNRRAPASGPSDSEVQTSEKGPLLLLLKMLINLKMKTMLKFIGVASEGKRSANCSNGLLAVSFKESCSGRNNLNAWDSQVVRKLKKRKFFKTSSTPFDRLKERLLTKSSWSPTNAKGDQWSLWYTVVDSEKIRCVGSYSIQAQSVSV